MKWSFAGTCVWNLHEGENNMQADTDELSVTHTTCRVPLVSSIFMGG